MKKFAIALLIFVCGLTSIFNIKISNTFALENSKKENVTSRSAYLCDPISGKVIYSKNEELKLPIASMCKIMTILLSFEEIDNKNMSFDDKIIVSENASGMGGSQVFLEANKEYLVEDLIKSIIVASANDACVAIAEKISGSEQLFVEKMNEKALSLGMNNTVFTNCTGLPKIGQHSTARDVSIMFSNLIKHKDYFRFSNIWTDEIKHDNDRITGITNTNKLVKFYQGCDGGKTGYTSESGHCLCATASRDGTRLVSVVISAPDSKTRFKEVSNMFNYGFANFENKTIIDADKPLDVDVKVEKGKADTLKVAVEKPISIFSKKGEKHNVEISFTPKQKVVAPVKVGEIIGKLTAYENGVEISTVNVVSLENVEKSCYFDYIKDISKNWSII